MKVYWPPLGVILGCFLFILCGKLNKVDSSLSPQEQCATLYSKKSLNGSELSIRNGFSYGDLESEYTGTNDAWNITESVHISSGCTFTACNESYFNGQCQKFTEDLPSLPQELGNILSANCTCAQNCKCEDYQKKMRKNSCARAYLYEGGCNRCNSYYTDLKGENYAFPEEFEKNVRALMVRPGCQLTIYDDFQLQGESRIIDGIESNWNMPIGSYECVCNGKVPPPEPTPTPENYPPMINVPNTVDEISDLIKGENGRHPGLLAALQSLRNKRSPRNAYILLLGSTGAGKSSAINLLFDNPNVTRVGAGSSTTKDIHEFRIPIPVPEFGIQNSELRVIDTPGLGDTKGIEVDAKFLATLEDFLNGHEELKDHVPNVVLIFHKFDDNRFDGPGSNFVKMIRGLDYFRTRLTDKKFSNVIFFFSHFTSEVKSITQNPKNKINHLKEVISGYSQFPKPLVLAVGENKAAEQSLPLINGYFKLPNGDYYPRNLFDKIQKATEGGGDLIGEAIIRTAFRNPDDFNVTASDFHLVDQKNSNVPKFLAILQNVIYGINQTEVSLELKKAADTMDPELKKKYPAALHYLQKSLNIRNMPNTVDIPRTTASIVELLTDLKQNDAILYLLKTAFGIEPPALKENLLTGYSYNVFKDMPLPSSPFNLGSLKASDIGFKFPDIMSCIVDSQTKDVINFLPTREDYLTKRIQSLNVGGNIPLSEFTGVVKSGYNIQSDMGPGVPVTAVRELRTFELVLNDRLTLSNDFTKAVRSLSPLNESDHVNVDQWKSFFNDWGTHVVKSVYCGGAIEISVTSSKPFGPEISKAFVNFIQFAEDISIGKIGNSSISDDSKDLKHILKFVGGDKAFHTTDLTKMSLQDAANLLENWRESLRTEPTILTSEMKLMPISTIVRRLGQNISSEIERATRQLFNSTLVYKPPPRPQKELPPEDRSHVVQMQTTQMFQTFMDRMLNESRRNEERFQALMEKTMEDQKQANKERLEWEEKKMKMLMEQQEKDRIRQEKAMSDAEERRLAENRRREEEAKLRQELEERRRKEEREYQAKMAEIQRKQQEDMMRIMRESRPPPPPSGGGKRSCLKTGTMILMADHSEKAVETLQVGDMILNHQLQPVRVSGVLEKFLLDDSFHGFDNFSYFFTDTHLLAGPSGPEDQQPIQLYSMNNYILLKENPLLMYLEPTEFSSDSEQFIFHYNKNKYSVEEFPVQVFTEARDYPPETPVYILLVESEEGTYFANGYACRHELPPLNHWPETMGLLFRLVSLPELKRIENVPYSLEAVESIGNLVEIAGGELRKFILPLKDEDVEDMKLIDGETSYKNGEIYREEELSENVVLDIFNDPTYSAFAVGVYGELSPILASKLDPHVVQLKPDNVRRLKPIVFNHLRNRFEGLFREEFPEYFKL